jgi:hypothetical protein
MLQSFFLGRVQVAYNRLGPDDSKQRHIPVFMTLAWHFVVSWTFGCIAEACRLHAPFGYLMSGCLLSFLRDGVVREIFLVSGPSHPLCMFVSVRLILSAYECVLATLHSGRLPAQPCC